MAVENPYWRMRGQWGQHPSSLQSPPPTLINPFYVNFDVLSNVVDLGRLRTSEVLKNVKRFPPKQKRKLMGSGGFDENAFFQLTGQSLKTLRTVGFQLGSEWQNQNPQIEGLISRRTEVVIDPDGLILPKSTSSYNVQKDLQRNVLEARKKGVGKVEIIELEALDVIEADLEHLQRTGQHLLGGEYIGHYILTKTSVRLDKEESSIVIGIPFGFNKMIIRCWPKDKAPTDSMHPAFAIAPK